MHIHDIAYPAYVKSAAPSHIVCIYVYIIHNVYILVVGID